MIKGNSDKPSPLGKGDRSFSRFKAICFETRGAIAVDEVRRADALWPRWICYGHMFKTDNKRHKLRRDCIVLTILA